MPRAAREQPLDSAHPSKEPALRDTSVPVVRRGNNHGVHVGTDEHFAIVRIAVAFVSFGDRPLALFADIADRNHLCAGSLADLDDCARIKRPARTDANHGNVDLVVSTNNPAR